MTRHLVKKHFLQTASSSTATATSTCHEEYTAYLKAPTENIRLPFAGHTY